MRGNIRKRGNSYSITVSLGKDPVTGSYRQRYETVRGTKKDAEKRLTEIWHEIDSGAFVKCSKTTLTQYLERWLKDYAWLHLAPRTAEGYQSIIRQHIIPSLGNIPLTQLKPEHLQRYYSEKLSNGRYDGKGALSRTTVSHHHTCLHRALKMALKWGMIARNPADAVTPPRPQRSEMQTMSESEVQTFLQVARETPYFALFYMALYTGMRRSEILALRWCDLDFLTGEVSITRSLHQLHGGRLVFRQPKTAKGRRMVALPPSAIAVMREYKENQVANRIMAGTMLKDDDLIFSTLEGKPLLPDTTSHAWTKIVKRARLKHFRLHDARHTHASLLLKAGTHPKVVQERLGHATISTTLDLYSHVAPGLQEAAAKSFDQIMSRQENVPAEKSY